MRIAHITDPHIRRQIPGTAVIAARRSREAPALLVRALEDAKSRGADVAALTGDLVDIPHYLFDRDRDEPADVAAWTAVREDYRWIRDTLDACGLSWIALPGNHDSQVIMTEVLGDRPRITDVAGVRFVSFWDRETGNHVPQRVLADRRRFDSALIDPDAAPQVHLQHYVITPELNAGYPHTYLEGEHLRRRIAESERVALVLSGHYHRGVDPERHGNAVFSVTPALTEAPHPYRIFDVVPDPAGGAPSVSWEHVDLVPDPAPARAVFLDRDGCINTRAAYHSGPEAMELLPGAAAAIRMLRTAGFRIVVATNQACIGSGYATRAIVAEVHDRLCTLLATEGAELDAIYASEEAGADAIHPRYEVNRTRKPHPTMLLEAARTLHLDLAQSFMVGDRTADVGAGSAAGATPILVRTGVGHRSEQILADEGTRCLVVDDLPQAAVAITTGRAALQVS